MKAPEYLIVHTTVDERSKAEFLARTILEAHLGACVQILPIHSLYRWEGRLESADEYRLEIKTRTESYPALEALLLRHHPYETPEILAIPVIGGAEGYLKWVDAECKDSHHG
jgi:periplasmic divalent cation tolerance protein